jgi:hypothetical protein
MHCPVPGEVLEGPGRYGSEVLWRVRTSEGRHWWVTQLLPELSRDAVVVRRYRDDVERQRALEVPGLAVTAAAGEGAAPWRAREVVAGESLENWLQRRAPAPIEEVVGIAAGIADVLAGIHAHGLVLRALAPAQIVLAQERPWIIDAGLGRVEMLSTRSAASLLLEGSPYCAPEAWTRSTLDPRADLHALGVILWRGLTGALPRGSGPAGFGAEVDLPPLRSVRRDAPEGLERLVTACLQLDPEGRPCTARDVADALRGRGDAGGLVERRPCQACGAAVRLGARLCVTCGREAVQFTSDGAERWVILDKIREDADQVRSLREILEAVGEGPVPVLNFILGDQRMYSASEQMEYLRVPLVLFKGLDEASAHRVVDRLRAAGLRAHVEVSGRIRGKVLGASVAAAVAGTAVTVAGLAFAVPLLQGPVLLVGGVASLIGGSALFGWWRQQRRARRSGALMPVRTAPAALPASDPLVARLTALLEAGVAPDVRARVADVALWTQRLVDHAGLAEPDGKNEVDLALATAAPVVDAFVRVTEDLITLDRELATLDESRLLRAVATARARDDAPEIVAAAERAVHALHELEARRSTQMQRLLEASSLLRRVAEAGLGVRDESTLARAELAEALVVLDHHGSCLRTGTYSNLAGVTST